MNKLLLPTEEEIRGRARRFAQCLMAADLRWLAVQRIRIKVGPVWGQCEPEVICILQPSWPTTHDYNLQKVWEIARHCASLAECPVVDVRVWYLAPPVAYERLGCELVYGSGLVEFVEEPRVSHA